jgi:glycerol-3-phosphate dehydrogenase
MRKADTAASWTYGVILDGDNWDDEVEVSEINARAAAEEGAKLLTERCPDVLNEGKNAFVVHVWHKLSGKRYTFNVNVDWDPSFYAAAVDAEDERP